MCTTNHVAHFTFQPFSPNDVFQASQAIDSTGEDKLDPLFPETVCSNYHGAINPYFLSFYLNGHLS